MVAYSAGSQNLKKDQIDCLACANCCRVATAAVTERDVQRLARHWRIAPARVLAEYTVESEEEGRVLRRTPEKGCVFLEGNACTAYGARPDTCIRFPHVVRGGGSIASRMWRFVDRATYCPIVYDALEAFKKELGFPK